MLQHEWTLKTLSCHRGQMLCDTTYILNNTQTHRQEEYWLQWEKRGYCLMDAEFQCHKRESSGDGCWWWVYNNNVTEPYPSRWKISYYVFLTTLFSTLDIVLIFIINLSYPTTNEFHHTVPVPVLQPYVAHPLPTASLVCPLCPSPHPAWVLGPFIPLFHIGFVFFSFLFFKYWLLWGRKKDFWSQMWLVYMTCNSSTQRGRDMRIEGSNPASATQQV